jgi:ABC-type nitrate/sulfonate/bicarbonate transport system substrate-binding protein
MILLVGVVGIALMGLSMTHTFIESTDSEINSSSSMYSSYNMARGATEAAWYTVGWSPYILGLALLIAMATVVFSVAF